MGICFPPAKLKAKTRAVYFWKFKFQAPIRQAVLPFALQVFSSEVKGTNTSSICLAGRQVTFSAKPNAVYRRNELKFLLKVNDILKKYSKMDGAGELPKSGKGVLCFSSLMASRLCACIFSSWQSLQLSHYSPKLPSFSSSQLSTSNIVSVAQY